MHLAGSPMRARKVGLRSPYVVLVRRMGLRWGLMATPYVASQVSLVVLKSEFQNSALAADQKT